MNTAPKMSVSRQKALNKAQSNILKELDRWFVYVPEKNQQALRDLVEKEKLLLVDKMSLSDLEPRLTLLRRFGLKVLEYDQWLKRYTHNPPENILKIMARQQQKMNTPHQFPLIAPLVVRHIVRYHYVILGLWGDMAGYENYLEINACNFNKYLYNGGHQLKN